MPYISINKNRLKKLLRGLIDIYSPSGKENEILEYVKKYLKSFGISIIRQDVDKKRYNLIVCPSDNRPEVLFLAHLDTVGAFDIERFQSRQKTGEIFGLGAADMKGGCAAMLEAFISFFEHNKSLPPAALALVVGEEEEGDGTKALIKKYKFPWAIVGEPTGMVICLSHYGYIEAEVKTFGKRRHASYSDYQHNAIFDMLNILLCLTNYLDKSRHGLIYNIRDVHSADSGFAVPDRCVAQLDIHLPPVSPLEGIIKVIEKNVNSYGKDFEEYKHVVNFPTINRGYRISDKGRVISIIKKIFNDRGLTWKPGSFRSHSDANILREAGTKPIILGPGYLAKAHSSNESVPVDQVFLASQVYFHILCRL
jgi:acetylornithine deacetylase